MNPNLKHLIILRNYAFLGVGVILFITHFFNILPVWLPSFYLLGFYGVTNFLIYFFRRKINSRQNELISAITLFDLIYLTLLIINNGGAHNPFTILFIAICSLAAMNLPRRHLLGIILFCLGCLWKIYNNSSVQSMPTAMHEHHHDSSYDIHLKGMWLANSIGVIIISYWIHFLRIQNEQMTKKHQEAQRLLEHLERVDSMGRLLAAAAHKLNTPLTTLQLGIGELSNKLQPLSEAEKDQWLADLQKALHQMTALFQTLKSEALPASHTRNNENLASYLETWAAKWAGTRGAVIRFDSTVKNLPVAENHLLEIRSALEAILNNAYEARKSDVALEIEIRIFLCEAHVAICIKDNGLGMDALTLARAMEPLFTTKKTGTGLGLYICHQLAKKLGGRLEIISQQGHGSEITLMTNKSLI